MAGLKMETGNSAAVIVLVVVLLGVIGFAFMRIAGPGSVAAAPPTEITATVQAIQNSGGPGLHPKTNPFKRSDRFKMPVAQSGTETAGPRMPVPAYTPKLAPLVPINDIQIAPMAGGMPVSQPVQSGAQVREPEPERPSFELLATVRSGKRISAVLRIGGSEVRTVGVGDALDGGFVVQELSADRAVLTNGRETIIADKEHARDRGGQRNGIR